MGSAPARCADRFYLVRVEAFLGDYGEAALMGPGLDDRAVGQVNGLVGCGVFRLRPPPYRVR